MIVVLMYGFNFGIHFILEVIESLVQGVNRLYIYIEIFDLLTDLRISTKSTTWVGWTSVFCGEALIGLSSSLLFGILSSSFWTTFPPLLLKGA